MLDKANKQRIINEIVKDQDNGLVDKEVNEEVAKLTMALSG